jgi:Tol biopolymer transport system component
VFGDGLYIARKDGSDTRRVLESSRARLASWSPDGEWLVYDRPTGEGNQGIYKLNLTTGEEVEIYRGGFNPNWSWAAGD